MHIFEDIDQNAQIITIFIFYIQNIKSHFKGYSKLIKER